MITSSLLSFLAFSYSSMSFSLDTCVKCESCHQYHRRILPKNYRIFLQLVVDEEALSHPLDDEVLDIMFILLSSSTRRAIHHVIGEDFYSKTSRHVLYPSDLVSIFLSNAMDLLQSTSRLEIIAYKVVKLEFWAQNKLKQAMQSYDLWSRNALVGRLFSRTMLM